MSGIFISYRRDDTAGYAGRIFDRIRERFGEDRVFMDVADIEPGVDFVEAIEKAVGSCDLLIALIGPRWTAAAAGSDEPRIKDAHDFVRLEIVHALERNIRLIPVLLGGASMPRVDELPDDLHSLMRRNAVEVSHTRFDADVDLLIGAVERALGQTVGDHGATDVAKSTPIRQKPDKPADDPKVEVDAPIAAGVSKQQTGQLPAKRAAKATHADSRDALDGRGSFADISAWIQGSARNRFAVVAAVLVLLAGVFAAIDNLGDDSGSPGDWEDDEPTLVAFVEDDPTEELETEVPKPTNTRRPSSTARPTRRPAPTSTRKPEPSTATHVPAPTDVPPPPPPTNTATSTPAPPVPKDEDVQEAPLPVAPETIRIAAETADWYEDLKIDTLEDGTICLGWTRSGSYATYANVDFGQGGHSRFSARIANGLDGGRIDVEFIDRGIGPSGQCWFSGTGDWSNWEEITCSIDAAPAGEHDVILTFSADAPYVANIDWFEFGP